MNSIVTILKVNGVERWFPKDIKINEGYEAFEGMIGGFKCPHCSNHHFTKDWIETFIRIGSLYDNDPKTIICPNCKEFFQITINRQIIVTTSIEAKE